MQYTQQQILEYMRCSEDPIYFIEKYIKLHTPVGITPFALYPYQKKYLHAVHNADNTPLLGAFARQMGMTSMMCAYSLWKAIFREQTKTLIIGFSQVHIQSVMSLFYSMHDLLPKWLQSEMIQRTKFVCTLENRSSVQVQTASLNSGRGMTNVWIDEPAQVFKSKEAHGMLASIVPCLSASGGSLILAGSGPDVLPLAKHFSYCNIFRAGWRAVPGRGEAWAEHQIAVLGKERFRKEYELD